MRLFSIPIILLAVCLSVAGCASFNGPFASSSRDKPRESERDRLLTDINTRMNQGDFEGARRLMDQLDPQARSQTKSRQQTTAGLNAEAGVEQTSFQPLPQIRPSQSQTPPSRTPRPERELIVDELLRLAPPSSWDYQRQQFALMETSQLRGMLATIRHAGATGQTFATDPGPEINPASINTGQQPDSGPPPSGGFDAPEPGARPGSNELGGFPFPGSPEINPRTSGQLPLIAQEDGPGESPGTGIRPADGRNLTGGVETVSGTTNAIPGTTGFGPQITPGNPFPPFANTGPVSTPTVNTGDAQMTNPPAGPAVLEPRIESIGDPLLSHPGHTAVGIPGQQALPLPPNPTNDDALQPGTFSQNLNQIRRAGESLAARMLGQDEGPNETLPFNPSTPLLATIDALENELATTSPEEVSVDEMDYQRKAVALRMLYMARNQYEKALEPIQGIDARDREFWQQMFWAMTNHFDTNGIPEPNARAAETIAQLRSAIGHLQEKADLQLRNVTFCHSIVSFGNYERFSRDQFTTGQPVLLYAEIENFTSKPLDDSQFQTALRSNVEIYRYGRKEEPAVASIPFDVTKDACRNVRRDYFHSYEFTIPEDLEPGRYTLVLQVSDQLSGKYATRRVQFEVE